jgi:hypothetical protein
VLVSLDLRWFAHFPVTNRRGEGLTSFFQTDDLPEILSGPREIRRVPEVPTPRREQVKIPSGTATVSTNTHQAIAPLQVLKLCLPGEVWLLVCDIVGASDRKSLAQTCRYLWMLINAKTPFLSQFIQENFILDLPPRLLALCLSLLASATEVKWLATGPQSFLSSDPLTVVEHISSSILRTLSGSSALQSLQLTQVEVSPYYQQAILRIPTLRTLTLCDATFAPTSLALPPTSIHVLVLQSLHFDLGAMEHLFRVLADSLETLTLGPNCSVTDTYMLYSILEFTPLQRFTSIRAPMRLLRSDFDHPFLFHSFITALHVTVERVPSIPSPFPDTYLPNLRHLSAPWCIAELIVPERPVQVFCETGLQFLSQRDLESKLVQLATSASNIEELEMCSRWTSPNIFTLLERHVPHLKRLRLLISDSTRYCPRRVREYMAMEPKFGVQCTSLQEIELRVQVPPEGRTPHQVSRSNCRTLSTLFIPICPALEVLSFIVTSKKFTLHEEDIAPRCIFKLQRMANGEWEERGFGIAIPEETKGYPIVYYSS